MGNRGITEINQPEELLAFIKGNEIPIFMTDKEAEILLGYTEGHGYVMGYMEEKLFRGNLNDVPGEIVWHEFSVDDLIDSVCDWNFELILDMEAAREEFDDIENFADNQKEYESLKEDEKVLDKLFKQTKYQKDIEQISDELTNRFIDNAKSFGVGKALNIFADDIKQLESGGRAR